MAFIRRQSDGAPVFPGRGKKEQRLRSPAFIAFFALSVSALVVAACGNSRDKLNLAVWNPYSADPPRDENFHGGPAAVLRAYDTNKDGTVTREEFQAQLRAEFLAADIGRTGCLSNTEVLAINQKRIEADQSTATPLQDWNQDGCVNYQEFATAPASLFTQFDLNRDGRVTALELDPRAGRGGRGATLPGTEGAGRGGRGGPPPQ
jgi:Ca2+-binding EF-hand superfamily protein